MDEAIATVAPSHPVPPPPPVVAAAHDEKMRKVKKGLVYNSYQKAKCMAMLIGRSEEVAREEGGEAYRKAAQIRLAWP